MPAPYDLTNVSNMTGVQDIFLVPNQLTGGLFGTIILFILWFVIFMQLKNYSTKPALLAASFITGIVALILWLLGVVNQYVLIVCVVITAISFVLNWGGD